MNYRVLSGFQRADFCIGVTSATSLFSPASRERIKTAKRGIKGKVGPALERGGILERVIRMAELTGCRANGRIRA